MPQIHEQTFLARFHKAICLLCFLALENTNLAYAQDNKFEKLITNIGGPEKMLSAIASNMAKKLPLQLDELTVLSSVSASGRIYIQTYLLSSPDPSVAAQLRKNAYRVKADTATQLCNSGISRTLIVNHQATYRYIYLQNTNEVLQFEITKTNC